MAVELKDLKDFLRIDADLTDDDALLASLSSAAVSYLEQTTGKKFQDDSALMTLAVKQLVLLWYENRTSYTTKTAVNLLPNHLQSIIWHIAQAGVYERLEESS